jgi:hypothetical protein
LIPFSIKNTKTFTGHDLKKNRVCGSLFVLKVHKDKKNLRNGGIKRLHAYKGRTHKVKHNIRIQTNKKC